MTARRVTAIPLFVLGGLLLVVLGVATVGAELYYGYEGIKQMIEGDIGQGLTTFFVTTTIVGMVLGLLSVPGAGLMALGETLWRREET